MASKERENRLKGQNLSTVRCFKCLEADDGSKPEILSKIAQATAALTKLKRIRRDNSIRISQIKGEVDALHYQFLIFCISVSHGP